MPSKQKARQALESKRASVKKDKRMIPQTRAFDMVNDDPEAWNRACWGFGAMFSLVWAVGIVLYIL